MLRERSRRLERFYHYYPAVVAVITARDGDRVNVMPAAWNTALSFDPPLFGVAISPKRHTYGLVKAAGEFGVSFLPFEMARAIAVTGRTSGREVDKVALLGLELEPPLALNTPLLKGAYAAYECRLEAVHRTGDHDLFVGRVEAVHWDPEAFPEGAPSWTGMRPTLYLGSDRYLVPLHLPEVHLPGADLARELREARREA